MTSRIAVRATRDAVRQLRAGSPWLYDGSITSVQAIYVPADDLTDPAPATAFAHLDATTVLSRQIASLGIYLIQTCGAVTGGTAGLSLLLSYATSVGFLGYAVGESNDDLKALIGAAASLPGPGFLLPARNGELFRWCLEKGLRVVQPMTLMSWGLYNEPMGAFLPSVIY